MLLVAFTSVSASPSPLRLLLNRGRKIKKYQGSSLLSKLLSTMHDEAELPLSLLQPHK